MDYNAVFESVASKETNADKKGCCVLLMRSRFMDLTVMLKGNKTIFEQSGLIDERKKALYEEVSIAETIAADPLIKTMNADQLRKTIEQTKKNMERAAKDMDFMEAARLRDEMFALQKMLETSHT